MTSQYVGIETARKTLGDLVDATQQGDDVILTRNGKPVARLTAYQSEDTMATLDLTATAAAVISDARTWSPLETAAEFDYDIGQWYDKSVDGIGSLSSPLGSACYRIANRDTPDDVPAADKEAKAVALWEQLKPELAAYARRCRDRKYSGWSSAARARRQHIQYAD